MLRLTLLLCCSCMLNSPAHAAPSPETANQAINEPGAVYFTPPEGWRMAESEKLPANVKVMVVGKGGHAFAPSLNLTIEPFKGSLKQYLKIVKAINDSKGAVWQDLGAIRTQAGNANLSQVDVKTEWGETRMMHAILIKNNNVYILTAAALKEEFPQFYKEFFNSLRSLRINKDVYEMVSNPKKRAELQGAVEALKRDWTSYSAENHPSQGSEETLFHSADFQSKAWKPFLEKLAKDYKDMSPTWREQVAEQTQNELIPGRE